MAVRKKGMVGGPRLGAGRPPGTGSGPSPDARRNRVTILLSDDELERLKDLAARRELPYGTLAYELFARSFKRAK